MQSISKNFFRFYPKVYRLTPKAPFGARGEGHVSGGGIGENDVADANDVMLTHK